MTQIHISLKSTALFFVVSEGKQKCTQDGGAMLKLLAGFSVQCMFSVACY